jgi:hypothetical protein
MRLWSRHPREAQLFAHYIADRHGEAPDPPTAEHLIECASCGGRYAAIARLLDAVRHEAESDADAVFTPERLLAQQQHIARRIEWVGRAARVINFPHPAGRTADMPAAPQTRPRWIAAAAAAGLFIGVALGAAYRAPWSAPLSVQTRGVRAYVPSPSLLAALGTAGSPEMTDVAADDAFLSELEFALERPRSHELLAFDALTPHVREVREVR